MQLPKHFRSLHFAKTVLRTIMKIIGLVLPWNKISLHRQAAMTYSHVEAIFGERRNHGKSQIELWTRITMSVLTDSASSRGLKRNHTEIPKENPILFASE